MTANSISSTMSQNSGIFWAMYKSCLLTGSLFVFLLFQDKDDISTKTRMILVGSMLVVGSIGTVLLLFLLPVPKTEETNIVEAKRERNYR